MKIKIKCTKCGFEFEGEQTAKCPRCGSIINSCSGCSGNCLKCSSKK